VVGVAASSSADGSTYPLFRERGVARQRFRLHVNTTNLAGGVLRFAMNPFTRASIRAAENGQREVLLDASNAEEFGYLGPMPTPLGPPQPGHLAATVVAGPATQPSTGPRDTATANSADE
jgi:hypothetical protein